MSEKLIKAIQEAVNAAKKDGVRVTVKYESRGFFPTEREDFTVTAEKVVSGQDNAIAK